MIIRKKTFTRETLFYQYQGVTARFRIKDEACPPREGNKIRNSGEVQANPRRDTPSSKLIKIENSWYVTLKSMGRLNHTMNYNVKSIKKSRLCVKDKSRR